MEENNKIIEFKNQAIRRVLHEGQWYFSVVDIIGLLTDSQNPRKYWTKLKERENQLETNCLQLKLAAVDGKKYSTDVAHTEGVFRILMSVPSPKVEPFKQWLAQVGKEKIEETANPELVFERLKELYKAKGYDDKWIDSRLRSIDIRKQLTDEWKNRGVTEGSEFSILTAEIAKATFGITPTEHKQLKGLEKQNLRDHMTNMELIFTMLGEEATRQFAVNDDAQGFNENQHTAQRGGRVAGQARQNAEKSGLKVLSSENFIQQISESETLALPESEQIIE